MLKTRENIYKGIVVEVSSLPDTKEEFQVEIEELISSLEDKNLVWVEVPIEKSEFIQVLTQLQFEFHHCDSKSITLVKRLVENADFPAAKNYTVGVGAVVRDGNNLLVVKDRFNKAYKLPGGHMDNNEKIKDAAIREVFEETGVKVEFESILNLGHFTQGQFGESVLYVVCTARPLSKEIEIHDTDEIIEAKWMDIDEFLQLPEVNNYNRNVVKAAKENKCLKLTDRPVKLRVDGGEVFL